MGGFIDLTGKKFNRLTVISRVSNKKGVWWNCVCDCGKVAIVVAGAIRTGNTKSCGCVNLEKITNLKLKHGMMKTSEYKCWRHMLERCNKEYSKDYKNYGARGITVCEEWKDSFISFFNDMGKKPGKEYSLDRKNNELGYSKENCRWATPIQQASNKRNTRNITFNSETKTLTEWSRVLKVPVTTLHGKLKDTPFDQLHAKYTCLR